MIKTFDLTRREDDAINSFMKEHRILQNGVSTSNGMLILQYEEHGKELDQQNFLAELADEIKTTQHNLLVHENQLRTLEKRASKKGHSKDDKKALNEQIAQQEKEIDKTKEHLEVLREMRDEVAEGNLTF